MALVLRGARAVGLLTRAANAPAVAEVAGVRRFGVTAAGRAGMGSPVPAHEPPTAPLPEEAELHWDCGDAYPEPALDRVPKSIVGVREAAAMLLAGLGVYVAVYQTALAVDKPSTQPFADKTFPFDGLKKELGR